MFKHQSIENHEIKSHPDWMAFYSGGEGGRGLRTCDLIILPPNASNYRNGLGVNETHAKCHAGGYNSKPTTAPTTEEVETNTNQNTPIVIESDCMNIKIGDNILTSTLVEISSVTALKAVLSKGPITVNMRDYGSMEKVGSPGMDLLRNDEQITSEAGGIILYQKMQS